MHKTGVKCLVTFCRGYNGVWKALHSASKMQTDESTPKSQIIWRNQIDTEVFLTKDLKSLWEKVFVRQHLIGW